MYHNNVRLVLKRQPKLADPGYAMIPTDGMLNTCGAVIPTSLERRHIRLSLILFDLLPGSDLGAYRPLPLMDTPGLTAKLHQLGQQHRQ
jgi:hypothetical protein